MRSITPVCRRVLSSVDVSCGDAIQPVSEISETRRKSPFGAGIAVFTLYLLLPLVALPRVFGQVKLEAGPTAENALASDEEIARAIRDNDADAIARMLDIVGP
jgi:hypothetical protein